MGCSLLPMQRARDAGVPFHAASHSAPVDGLLAGRRSKSTGNPMDVAISGSGFFAVNGPKGPLYTRNGSLQVLPSGELATADGYALRNTSGGND